MPKIVTCDICGKPGEECEDGICRCELHELEGHLCYKRLSYQKQRRWVREIHIKELIRLRTEIRSIERRIEVLSHA